MAVSIIFILGLIFYGAYLNQASEEKISEQIANYEIPVRAAKAEYKNISASVQFPVLKFYSNKMVDAITAVNGQITEIFVKKGDFVEAGQLLCKIVDKEIPMKIRQAELSIMDAEGQLQTARNILERQKKLFAKDATSLSKVEEAETHYKTAFAKLEDAKSKREQLLMQESSQELVSPISGKILTEYKNLGSGVNSGTPIFMIGDFSELFCEVTVTDAVAKNFSEDSTAIFKFQSGSEQFFDSVGKNLEMYASGTDFSETGTIFKIIPSLDEFAENRKIIWKFDNRARNLEPAIYAEVIVNTSRPHKHLVIPKNSLINLKNSMVFVLENDDTIHLREISTGASNNEFIEVISGLSEGEMVITSLTEDLKDGSKVELRK